MVPALGFFPLAEVPNKGRIIDAADAVASDIFAMRWPVIVRGTIHGTMGGRDKRVVFQVILTRQNRLFRNRRTVEQKTELVGLFLFKAAIRALRHLHATPSSKSDRRTASKRTKRNKFYDPEGVAMGRFNMRSISFSASDSR
jgi:hypothetical protein